MNITDFIEGNRDFRVSSEELSKKVLIWDEEFSFSKILQLKCL